MNQGPEYVVVDIEKVQALMTAIKTLLADRKDPSDGPGTEARNAVDSMRSKPLMNALRMVGSQDDIYEPAMLFVPPGVNDEDARQVLASAVDWAGAITADGETDDYWERLQERLSQKMPGAFMTQDIAYLDRNATWDRGKAPEEPFRLAAEGDEEWARVRFSSDDNPDAREGVLSVGTLMDGGGAVQLLGEGAPFIGFASNFEFRYPRSHKYGVPVTATDDGARKFIVQHLGFCCSRDLEIYTEDTGDDSGESFELECLVPRKLLQPVPEQRQELRDRAG